MSRPARSRNQRQRRERRTAWLIFGLAGVILVGVLVSLVMFQPAKLGENGCPIDRHLAPSAKTVVVVDQTDALSATELAFVRRLVRNEYFWLPSQAVLELRRIEAEVPEGVTALTACRMSDGSDALGLVDNPAALRKEYDRKVGNALSEFLRGMSAQAEQSASPILETLVATAQDPDFSADIPTRRLVVVSDMAQNSAVSSHYGRAGHFSLTPEQAEAYDARFDGMTVRIQYIRRTKLRMQGAAHKAFWKRFFTHRGATDVAIGHDIALGEPKERKVWHDTATKATPIAR